jgi:hypothetical protein
MCHVAAVIRKYEKNSSEIYISVENAFFLEILSLPSVSAFGER